MVTSAGWSAVFIPPHTDNPLTSPPFPPTQQQRAIEADYAAICDVAPQLAQVATLDEFKWARMCVCSRYVI